MERMARRHTATLVILIAALPILIGISVGPAAADDTTTTAAPTTTSAPSTTTTLPPTTTTSTTQPTTTTTRAHPTTTTSTSTTTTTTTPHPSTTSSKTWGWVLLAVVVALAAILVGLILARVRRRGQEADWERSIAPVVAAAELARDLVLSQTPTDDQQHRASVGARVDEAVAGLERAARSAPEEQHRSVCNRCAASLRGLAFAVEADHLMRSGGEHPTGDQLASADAARRNRSAEFENSLQELKLIITPTR